MRVEADLDSGVRRNDGWVRDGYPVSSTGQAVRWNDGGCGMVGSGLDRAQADCRESRAPHVKRRV